MLCLGFPLLCVAILGRDTETKTPDRQHRPITGQICQTHPKRYYACRSRESLDKFFTAVGDKDEATIAALFGECFRLGGGRQVRILDRPWGSNDLQIRLAGDDLWTTTNAVTGCR